jgi:fatty acid desaturase
MFDSTTIPGRPLLTELWAPLGQRYHALHHLMPSIPYHSLGIAHRRLMRNLPPDSPCHQTLRPSLLAALVELYRGAKAGGRQAALESKEAA